MRKSNRVGKICLVVIVLTMVGLIFLGRYEKTDLVNTELIEEIVLKPEKIIYFEDFGMEDFVCTGLTYDIDDDTFWIADYGYIEGEDKVNPRLISVSSDFSKVLKIIPILGAVGDTACVQGIAYDCTDNCIWIATGKDIVSIDKIGKIQKKFSLGEYENYIANGVSYHSESETLWVLCYSKYLLKYDKNGNLLKRFDSNYLDQDHIFFDDEIFVSAGADYNGDDNYVIKIDPLTGEENIRYKMLESFAIEGICVKEGNLYVANDGAYHNAKIKKSYISVYEWK